MSQALTYIGIMLILGGWAGLMLKAFALPKELEAGRVDESVVRARQAQQALCDELARARSRWGR